MARAIYPITKIGRPLGWEFPLDLEDIFEKEGAKADDQFTYTTRYQVENDNKAAVERIKACVRDNMDPDDAERFIAFMEEHDWDVSFLVDTF